MQPAEKTVELDRDFEPQEFSGPLSNELTDRRDHAPGDLVPDSSTTHTRNVKPSWNTFDDGIAKCVTGVRVLDDHLFASPLLGFVNPADNKCGTGSGNIGSGPLKPGDPPFNPKTTFGHLHAGPAEWWIYLEPDVAKHRRERASERWQAAGVGPRRTLEKD